MKSENLDLKLHAAMSDDEEETIVVEDDNTNSNSIITPPKKSSSTKQSGKRSIGDLFDCEGCIMYQDRSDDLLVPRMIIPRVVKNDIRRFFPRMVANVYNYNDPDLMASFMQTYYTPDFALVQQLFADVDHMPTGRYEFHGLQQCTSYWKERMEAMPDSIFKLTGSEVQILSDEVGLYRIKFMLTGTQIVTVKEVKVNALSVDTANPAFPVYKFDETTTDNQHNDATKVVVSSFSPTSSSTTTVTTVTAPLNPLDLDEDLVRSLMVDDLFLQEEDHVMLQCKKPSLSITNQPRYAIHPGHPYIKQVDEAMQPWVSNIDVDDADDCDSISTSSSSSSVATAATAATALRGNHTVSTYLPDRFVDYYIEPAVPPILIPCKVAGELLIHFDVDCRVFSCIFNCYTEQNPSFGQYL